MLLYLLLNLVKPPKKFIFSTEDESKVKKLDQLVTSACGFTKAYLVTGQTYSRRVDVDILNSLSALGASAHKV